MPLLYLHLSIAKEAAELLHHPVVDPNMGSYLVGAISPDVHYVSGVSRKETHFFDFDTKDCESGAGLLFKAHPDLARGRKLDATTKSFIAGYLSHLIADEVWILDIYRPFFGNLSPLGSDPMANALDRLLQFELDRREREDKAKMAAIRAELCQSEPQVNIDFLATTTLRQWRDFVCAAMAREVTLADFPPFARSFLLPSKKIDAEQLEPFLLSVPDKLDWAIQHVTPQRLTAFRGKAISQSVKAAREYLGEDN
ncbi:MAG: zinc dependent phospholipase C family protein [Dehalococcoidia bacterium]|nr:zinc dependent phospholipase C family protein [Dehalococcoidia bacterium]